MPIAVLGLDIDLRCLAQRRAGQAGFRLDLLPAGGAHLGGEFVEAVGVLLDEIDVEHMDLLRRPSGVLGSQHMLGEADQRGDVAARLDLMILAARSASPCCVSISTGFCGLTKTPAPARWTGLKVTILQPRFTASCRSWRKRGLFDPVFWPKKNIASQCSKSLERAGADRRADQLLERDRGGLVAHVRAVGQVVVPIEPREQAHRDRRSRGWPGPRRRRRRSSDRAPSAPRRSRRRPPPSRMAHICRLRDRSAADGSAAPAARDHNPSSSRSSVTVCSAKKSGVQRCGVSSQRVALAPFSQNSNGCGLAGLPQAQETQAKPSGLFCSESVLQKRPARAPSLLADAGHAAQDPHPPAGRL